MSSDQDIAESKINLTVAGKPKEYPQGLTVARLIELENVETPLYVTVSVNDAFVARERLADTELHDGDQVEFLYFMGGGC